MPATERDTSVATTASGDVGVEAHDFILVREVADGADAAVADPAVANPAVAEPPGANPAVAEPPGANPAVAEDRYRCGSLGIYQGKWGGCRTNRDLNEHILQDVIRESVCQVFIGQEVDWRFVEQMRHGEDEVQRDFNDFNRTWRKHSWLVACGEEDCKTNVVAGRASVFTAVAVVEWHKSRDGEYRQRRGNGRSQAFSRILVADLQFARPHWGIPRLRVASVHINANTAKRARGMNADAFFCGLFFVLCRTKPDIIAGDFNMALFKLREELDRVASRFPGGGFSVHLTLLAAYAWVRGDAYRIEEDDEGEDDGVPAVAGAPRAPAVAGAVRPPVAAGNVMFDSCGIFAGSVVRRVKMKFDPAVAGGGEPASRLATFRRGQGYPITSYKGGAASLQSTCDAAVAEPDGQDCVVPAGESPAVQ